MPTSSLHLALNLFVPGTVPKFYLPLSTSHDPFHRAFIISISFLKLKFVFNRIKLVYR